MVLKLTWRRALAWRMRRQLIDPVGEVPVTGVVRRLCGVQAQVASYADLAVRLRRASSRPDEVGRAISDGRLIKTWAMRGALHLLAPEQAGAFLSLLAAGHSWGRPSWERYFGMRARDWDALREAVREALDGAVLTREELAAKVTARRDLAHIGEALRSGWGTLLRPSAFHGELCFGPSRGRRVTFMRPEAASARWTGIPAADEAGPAVIAAYLSAYGPATIVNFRNWLSRGRVEARRIRAWFAAVGDRVAEVEVDGERAYVLAADLDELTAARASPAVRLLPGFDQYVLGPGTEDGHVIPPARRSAVSRAAGWIAPVVVAGGVVSGTWQLDGGQVRVAWFRDCGRVPRTALRAEVERVSAILERDLDLSVAPA